MAIRSRTNPNAKSSSTDAPLAHPLCVINAHPLGWCAFLNQRPPLGRVIYPLFGLQFKHRRTEVITNEQRERILATYRPWIYGYKRIAREGGLIRRIRTEAVRLIRHLGPVPVTLLIFPEAEGTSFV